jgi:hypothetical protein
MQIVFYGYKIKIIKDVATKTITEKTNSAQNNKKNNEVIV